MEKLEDAALRLTYLAGDEPIHFWIGLRFVPKELRRRTSLPVLSAMQPPLPGNSPRTGGVELRALHRRHLQDAKHDGFGARAIPISQAASRVSPKTEGANLDWFPRRPKGMRRATYQRIRAEAWKALGRYDEHQDKGLIRTLARIAPELVKVIGVAARCVSGALDVTEIRPGGQRQMISNSRALKWPSSTEAV